MIEKPGPLIDCHAHVWGHDMPYVRTAWTRPDYAYTVEDYLADLDSQGVRYGVIAAASLFGTYNDYTIRAIRTHHDRLRATVNVDPTVDLYTLEAMRADGVVGVRLMLFFVDPLPDLDGDEYRRLLHRLRDLGMHVHVNIEGDRLVETATLLASSGVRLVIDHFGWHDPALGLDAPSYRGLCTLLERDNVWVKITSGFRHPEQADPDWSLQALYAADLLARSGTDKLLWGSDAPWVRHEAVANYGMAVDGFAAMVPDADARRAIGENGYRFYFGT